MSSFTIMVDTSCDLPQEYLDKNSVRMIPIPFHIDGKQHSGGLWQEISDKEFYKALHEGSVAGTAMTNPETYAQVFSEYAEKGEDLLMLILSSGLSGSYENACIALAEVKEKYPGCGVHIIDTITAAGGVGLMTVLAVKKRGEGMGASKTADWLNDKKSSCISLFTVDDLMYLHRGGRLSKVSAVAGRIIGIKPLLNVSPEGTLKLKDKARGRKSALSGLVKQMKRSLNPDTKLDTIVISHSDCIEDAEALIENVRASVDVREILVAMMSPVIGAHVGPGTVALFFEADMTRPEYESKFYSK